MMMVQTEYSASSVKYLLWFVETRETVRLLQDHSSQEVRQIVLDQNIYQQKDPKRVIEEFGCISRRIAAMPDQLAKLMVQTDVATAKLIAIIASMAADRLFFELMFEVYREKLRLGDEEWRDSDFNVFYSQKADQSDAVAGWSEATNKKLRSVYHKWMMEAGLLQRVKKDEKRVIQPYIDPELREVLLETGMNSYLYAMTGEQ